MSFIDLKNKDNDQQNLIPKGTYEMIISKVTGDASKSGHECMKFDFEIRRDLDKVPALAKTNAICHGRHFFANVWTAKDKQTGQDSGAYSPKDLANIADAIGLTQADIDKNIHSKDDLMKACEGKAVRIYVSLNKNTYEGQTREQNSTFTNTWHKTKFPLQGTKKMEDPYKNAKTSDTDISDDDLPF